MTDQKNIPIEKRTSEALAAVVVAHRSLGLFKEESRLSMIELMRRKDAGDEFDFDQYIKNKLDLVPKPDEDNPVKKFLRTFSMGFK